MKVSREKELYVFLFACVFVAVVGVAFCIALLNSKDEKQNQLEIYRIEIGNLIEENLILKNQIADASKKVHCHYELLIKAIIEVESGGDPNATNGRDNGLMQINGGVFCPEQNVIDGSLILQDLIHRSLTAYNRGWTGANRFHKKHGKFDSEYSNKVINLYKEFIRLKKECKCGD